MTMNVEIENNDEHSENEKNESTPPSGADDMLDKVIDLIGEDNAKNLSDNQFLVTTHNDLNHI